MDQKGLEIGEKLVRKYEENPHAPKPTRFIIMLFIVFLQEMLFSAHMCRKIFN